MYLVTTPATRTDPEDRELIEETGEGASLFVEAMLDAEEVVVVLMAMDDISEREDIELDCATYFNMDKLKALTEFTEAKIWECEA